MPELTVYLDIESEIGLRRIAEHRSDQVNRLDKEKLAFHQAVRQAYLRMYHNDPDRIKLVDASQPLDQVITDVRQVIHTRYPDLF